MLSDPRAVWHRRNRRYLRCIDRGRSAASAAAASALLVVAVTVAGLTLLAMRAGGSDSGGAVTGAAMAATPLPPPAEDEDLEAGAAPVEPGRRQFFSSNVTHLLLGGVDRPGSEWLTSARFHPSSFLPESSVLNDTVYCDNPMDSQLAIFYSEPTWLCKNIRVGKRRIPFTDTMTRTQDELTMYRRRELDLSGPDFSNDMCGRLPDRGNNVFLLCELLLAQLGESFPTPPMTSSVHVPFGNCSLPEHGRAILVGETEADAVWHAEEKLWPGFVTDIFCSFALR